MSNPNPPGVLLVTGGASGIGASVVEKAARQGYRVAINYHTREDAARKMVDDIERSGGRAICIEADVSDPGAVARMFDETDKRLGKVTALVNSAGISINKSTVAELDGATAERLFRINILGSLYPTQEAVRRMSTAYGANGGTIVNVSSMAATTGGRPGSVAYASSKGAVDVFTKGLAREVAEQGIRVNAVRPGMTISDMTPDLDDPEQHARIAASIPMGRVAEAGEVADAIMWLLSDEASFVTGALLDVSGGGFKIGV
jgi:NAD(P)-dependent dehydrogenase (short-subunit alcohol dehydrogenase family)